MQVGDEVLIRLLPDLNPAHFGSDWRIGFLTGIGTDLLAGEPVYVLDDDGPPIYAAHVDYITVLTRSEPEPVSASVFDG